MAFTQFKHSGTLNPEISVCEKKHSSFAEKAAEEGIVLLKNENILPISLSASVALLGIGADKTVKGGIGSGDVNNRQNITIYEGMAESGIQITSRDWLDNYEHRYQEARLIWKEKILEEASHELSEIRKEYSKQLDEKIIEGLKELNFEDVDFSIRFDRRKNYTDNGYDAVEYEISTNPGESRKPLGQIVSGGELSRIMLAIKAILADKDQIDTLIFDEIDTGISGRTAQKVSEKMAVIGQHRQVLCITHLPQIAAMAATHFEIEKHVEGTETITQIHPLEGEESVRELARLLGGAQITPAVLGNAREMKELAQQQKNTRLK